MDTLINPSTGTEPRRSSHAGRRSDQVDIRTSSHFQGPRSRSHPSSLFPAGKQQRDERGYPIGANRGPARTNQDDHTDSDAGHKKLEASDLTRSDSGWDDGFTDEERARLDMRVLRKTDIAFLPLMGIIVMLQYLDKAILSYAALLGLTFDLQLTGNEYNWACEYTPGGPTAFCRRVGVFGKIPLEARRAETRHALLCPDAECVREL